MAGAAPPMVWSPLKMSPACSCAVGAALVLPRAGLVTFMITFHIPLTATFTFHVPLSAMSTFHVLLQVGLDMPSGRPPRAVSARRSTPPHASCMDPVWSAAPPEPA
eukprot:1157035-Pelagomonas_calceolata.AAC.4